LVGLNGQSLAAAFHPRFPRNKENAQPGEAFAWMKSVLDSLAAKYAGNQKFTFAYDETTKSRYRIVFDDGKSLHFTVDLANPTGSRYWLYVTRGHAEADRIEDAFIYKSYPDDRRENVMGDLVTLVSSLLKANRTRWTGC